MSAFDLTDLTEFAWSVMADDCEITADTLGADDDTLNQTTGKLTPVSDAAFIYAGICQVSVVSSYADRSEDEAGRDLGPVEYRIQVPLAATGVERGQIVTMLTGNIDPALAGKRFKILSVSTGTQVVRRTLLCTDQW